MLAHDGPDPGGGQSLPVGSVAAQRIEHVRDADDHRAEVQRAAADVLRIARKILLQMMFERDDRRESRHAGRLSQNVGAVHHMLFHDVELFLGELVRLVEHLGGRVHFSDVVHECRQAELAQQRSVYVQRARLRHGQHRHVDHVSERVIVVSLQRRQRDERRSSVADESGQRVDDGARRIRIWLLAGSSGVPERFSGRHRLGVGLARGSDTRADARPGVAVNVPSGDRRCRCRLAARPRGV